MIISNSHRFIFVHIHKTAGTSLSKALNETARWNDVFCQGPGQGNVTESWYQQHYGLEKHAHADAIRKAVGQDIWDAYFSFSFVRNPYYRIVSLYTWLQGMLKRQSFRRYARRFDTRNPVWEWEGMKALLATRSFSQFIRNEHFARSPGARPMFDWLSDSGVLIVDFVGRLESLSDDFDRIRGELDLGPEISIPRTNVSRTSVNLSDFYAGQEDLNLIYDRYKVDFETFGYHRLSQTDL